VAISYRQRLDDSEAVIVNAVVELFAISEAATTALEGLHKEELRQQLAQLEKACNEAKRAWSGSSLGYHADTYWEGLALNSNVGQFNPEWGLMDRWPTHQPAAGWRVMDPQAVRKLILARAGDPDIGNIDGVVSAAQEAFRDLKESALSLLISISDQTDGFIKRKLDEIEKLSVVSQEKIAISAVRSHGVMTRDSRALAQGGRVAAHQRLAAVYLSATVTTNALKGIKKCSQEAALHLERAEQRRRKMPANGSTVFIGHGGSLVWLQLKDFLKDTLHLDVDEFNSVSTAGIPTVTRLEEMLAAARFAFLIMTAEDEQKNGSVTARQNVVHEAGLFQGRLGFNKAIILLEEQCQDFSNIRGLTHIPFPQGNVKAAFEDVRRVLAREGVISAD
jgi:predicted nucleotide-binding protein